MEWNPQLSQEIEQIADKISAYANLLFSLSANGLVEMDFLLQVKRDLILIDSPCRRCACYTAFLTHVCAWILAKAARIQIIAAKVLDQDKNVQREQSFCHLLFYMAGRVRWRTYGFSRPRALEEVGLVRRLFE